MADLFSLSLGVAVVVVQILGRGSGGGAEQHGLVMRCLQVPSGHASPSVTAWTFQCKFTSAQRWLSGLTGPAVPNAKCQMTMTMTDVGLKVKVEMTTTMLLTAVTSNAKVTMTTMGTSSDDRLHLSSQQPYYHIFDY